MSVYDQLADAEETLARENFAPRPGYVRLYVDDVERDGLGNPLIARGTDPNGVGGFPVIVAGRAQVEKGETILAEFDQDAPAGGALYYKAHLSSDLAGMGAARVTPGPPPSYAPGTWNTSRIDVTPNGIYARITILFTIEPRYNPSKVIISHRQAGRVDWTDQVVPFLKTAAIQSAELSKTYPSGVNVDIALRAEYAYAYGPSDLSEVRDVLTPTDGTTPGNASALDVNVAVAGILRAEATGTIDRSRFVGWRYEFTQSPTGPPTATVVVDGFYEYHVPVAGAWYVAVAPISVSGVLGGRYPSATLTVFSGPFTIPIPALPPDNTPPAVWSAPTLTGRVLLGTLGGATGYLKVDFPTRALFEADYKTTVVRLTNGTIVDEWPIEYRGVAPSPIERQIDFGVWTVGLYAVDTTGNKSILSPTTNVTIADPGIPAAAGTPTITVPNPPLANQINWVIPARATIVELQRATDALGTGAVTINQGYTDHWLDIHTELTTFPTSYWYRVRGRNTAGDGIFSGWVQGTITAVSGTVVAANTLVGDRIVVGTLDGNTLKASFVISSVIKTATSGARVEINGPASNIEFFDATLRRVGLYTTGQIIYRDGTNARALFNQDGVYFYNDSNTVRGVFAADGLRFYNDTTTLVRMFLGSNFFIFYGDGAQNDILMGMSGGRGYLQTGGVRLSPYNLEVDVTGTGTLGAYGVRLYHSGGGQAEYRFQDVAATNGGTNALGLVGDTNTTDFAPFFIGGSPNFSGNLSSGYTRFDRGTILTTGKLRVNVNSYSDGAINAYAGVLPATAGANSPAAVRLNATSTNNIELYEGFYRFQGTSGWPGTVYFAQYMVDNGGFVGGTLMLGSNSGSQHYWALGQSTNANLYWSGANAWIESANNFHISGTLSKAAGTFRIPHPDPAKSGIDLRHSFVEGPTRGDNLYRFTVEARRVTEDFAIPLPDYFRWLNVLEGEGEDEYRPQVWVSTDDLHRGVGRGKVSKDGTTLIVETVGRGRYNVLVLATRKDTAARDHWDGEGGAEIPRALPDDFGAFAPDTAKETASWLSTRSQLARTS